MLLYQILTCTIHGKIQESHKTINLISAPNRKKNSNYLMDHVLHQIFQIILSMIYVSKI